jgi:hypothetical protein
MVMENITIRYSTNAEGDDGTAEGEEFFTTGYVCPYCNYWIKYGEPHICYNPYQVTFYPPIQKSKLEQAYDIFQVLIKAKIIEYPDTYEKLQNLLQSLSKALI